MRFEDCNLAQTDLQDARLTAVVFSDCDLRAADFSGARLASGCELRGCAWRERAAWSDCAARGCHIPTCSRPPRPKAFGATDVAISDVNEHRLSAAQRMGATRVLRADDDAPGEVDALIECSGHPRALVAGIEVLRPAGTAVLVGMGPLITGHYDLADTETALLAGHDDPASIKVMVHHRTTG